MAKSKICSISGCDKPHMGRGWCNMHLTRWRRHGDPLKKIYKGERTELFLRDVVFAYKTDDCVLWPYFKSDEGYTRIWRNGECVTLTRFICEETNGPPPSSIHQAAHSCGKAKIGCCNPRHLRWATPKENAGDKLIHGTVQRGRDIWKAKLYDEDVLAIRALRSIKMPFKEIAEIYGIHPAHACNIVKRKMWTHI